MVGQTLKQYKIVEMLGKGGMGVVYRADDMKLHRPVAIKVLSAELTSDPERRRRFLLEARSAARITHPSIAQVYDVDEENGVTFIAMELVEGKTVRRLIEERELDLLGSLDVAIQVAQGLVKAHEAGIIHRDVKSDNVILTPDGHAKILDFGLAKLLHSDSDSGDNLSQIQTLASTQAGMVMGTVAYMSPEQARGKQVDPRSDIFSLGVMIYEMVTGELPFKGVTVLDTMHAIAFEESRPINSIRQGLPVDLQRIVSRCLRKRPEDRYADCRKLGEDLTELRRDTESGRVRALSLRERVTDWIDTLRAMRPSDYAWFAVGSGVVLFAAYLLMTQDDWGGLILLGLAGLFGYRTIRNRPEKMLRRFVAKVSKLPEVRVVVIDGKLATVLVERAPAKLYQRINDLMSACNRKLFFGEPMKVAIRDEVGPEELRKILAQPGVRYVREDAGPAA